ncbi:MAG TPA: hypothetical protein V6C96_02810, partial [Vampirovibrionales bacterium]
MLTNNNITKEQYIKYLAAIPIEKQEFDLQERKNEKNLKLANPIKEYWQQVNRFLFSGGVHIDVSNAEKDDPRQDFLDNVITYTKLKDYLYSCFKELSVYGELLVTINLTEENKYVFSYFTKNEFEYNYSSGELKEVSIYAKRKQGKKYYVFKQKFTPETITNYPLVELKSADTYDWEKHKKEAKNNYKECPCILIQNNLGILNDRGEGDFDDHVIGIVEAIFMLLLDGCENIHFMGDPLLLSPEPDITSKEMQNKEKVITKFEKEDGGKVEALTLNPISAQSLEYLSNLEVLFKKALGIRYTESDNTKETSSVTLKILNSLTINKAQEKWDYIINQGFIEVLQKTLKYSYIDGNLKGYSSEDPEDYKVTITRIKPFFPESYQEKLT